VFRVINEEIIRTEEEQPLFKSIFDHEGCVLKKCCKAYKKKGKHCKKCPKK